MQAATPSISTLVLGFEFVSTCLHVKQIRLSHLPSTPFHIALHSYFEFQLLRDTQQLEALGAEVSCQSLGLRGQESRDRSPLLSENPDRRFAAVTSFNNSADRNQQQFRVELCMIETSQGR